MDSPAGHWREVARESFSATDGWPAYDFVTLEKDA